MYELIYTSTPKGLLAGRSGFSTVAMTAGFPPNLIAAIENMSGYKPLFPPGTAEEGCNPVNYSCRHYLSGTTRYTVLSKISFAGLSYTGRTNILAQHLLLTREELAEIPGGAAAILAEDANFPPWEGEPRLLPQRSIQSLRLAPVPKESAEMWEKLAGDKRFAPWTAAKFRKDPGKPIILSFDPLQVSGRDILELIRETSACLKPADLPDFTFCTYCYASAIADPPALRAYPQESQLLKSVSLLDPASIIQLGQVNTLPAGAEEYYAPPPTVSTHVQTLSTQTRLSMPAAPSVPRRSGGPVTKSGTAPSAAVSAQLNQKTAAQSRLLPILIAIFAVLLAAAAAWRLFFYEKSDDNELTVISTGDTAATEKIPLSEEKTQPAKPAKPAIPAKPASSVQPTKPEKTAEPVRNEPAETKFGRLSAGELLKLHTALRTKSHFPLPPALEETTAVELIPDGIGELKVTDPAKYVRGNRSSSVTILAAAEEQAGLSIRTVPVRNTQNSLILRLQNGTIVLKQPTPDRLHPHVKNIRRIRFHGPLGKVFSLEMKNPADAVYTELNKVPGKLSAEFEKNTFRVSLHVSNELWAMRDHVELRVDGRVSGGAGITERKIQLKQVEFAQADTLTRKRNGQLDALAELQQRIKLHSAAKNIPKTQPRLSQELRKKYAESVSALDQAMKDGTSDLFPIIDKMNCGARDILLDNFGIRWKIWQEHQNKSKQLKNEQQDILRRYENFNKALQQHLLAIYPILHTHFQADFKNRRPVTIEKLQEVSLSHLKKAIKIEVIKRKHDEIH